MAANNEIGLIGVGLVGSALAERLTGAGFAVIAYDVDPAFVEAIAGFPIRVAASAREVAKAAAFVLLALPDTDATESVVGDMAPVLSAGAILIDVSTDDPERIASLAATLAGRGVHLIDAPLSGSSVQIRGGDAVAIAGGERRAFDDAAAIFSAISRHAFHFGPSGSGLRAKLATNLLLGLNRAVLAEGLVFAEALGLDPSSFLAMARVTPAYSRAIDAKGDKMIARSYLPPESRVRQHRKDVALMLAAAARLGCVLPLSEVHATVLDAAIAAGDGELDSAAIVEELRRRGGAPKTPQ
ncbi:MAG: NAD(P)-dependent oxidoreductase [Pseudomonadota bacterium]|nr:NAD(P)-dependent oxidoreductase [Pseudomonadota bacterium]